MAKPTRIEIDCSTGVQRVVDLTDAEIAQLEADAVTAAAEEAAREAAEAAALAAKESAQAKLTALGLTANEIAALIK